ncbi:Aste57867_16266 [Aphanomyces stellatus]|uniref:Aste57867_16266 protein n=1 Tax=Aphanomyces stellatus TaxID=120398 RepID=A0A485L8A9_9STRA|nr:hypothetical protein As57867_016209 [Aphanomyces stellatus]VFT93042.1 Aste57867_16266 [Aphanomyces stellatus]
MQRAVFLVYIALLVSVAGRSCSSQELSTLQKHRESSVPDLCIPMGATNRPKIIDALNGDERMVLCSLPICIAWFEDQDVPDCDDPAVPSSPSLATLVKTLSDLCAATQFVTQDTSKSCNYYDMRMLRALPLFPIWPNCSAALDRTPPTRLLDVLYDPHLCSAPACTEYVSSLMKRAPSCIVVVSGGTSRNTSDSLLDQLATLCPPGSFGMDFAATASAASHPTSTALVSMFFVLAWVLLAW